MTAIPSALELTQSLIRFDTINPPGAERACLKHLAGVLTANGFETRLFDYDAPARANLIARLPATEARRSPLAFTGHVDVVPLGQRDWSVPPFEGRVTEGRVWGRGASDMKSGVAAFVAAAAGFAAQPERHADIILIVTAGEETGSEGAQHLADTPGVLQPCGALVVAEPTDGRPLVGHKGALWLTMTVSGVTAHGSMPEKGVNAVVAAARLIDRLARFEFGVAAHPVMGAPTLSIGTISGGLNINSVPDRAVLGVDIRTIEGQQTADVLDSLQALAGQEVVIAPRVVMESVFTDPETPFVQGAFGVFERLTGRTPAVETAMYFTDASVLTPALGSPPTLILGPGPMAMAHQTDEYCEIATLDRCVDAYRQIIAEYVR